jgi:hypothetical protein
MEVYRMNTGNTDAFQAGKMATGRRGWRTMMSWRSPLRRFVLLGGAVLWFPGFLVPAQERSFFAAGSAVGLTAAQANRRKAVYDDNYANYHGTNLEDIREVSFFSGLLWSTSPHTSC